MTSLNRLSLLFGLLLLPACEVATPDDDDDSVPDPPVDDCEGDAECDNWEICEGEVCVDGDRNNAIDEARFIEFGDVVSLDYISPAGDIDYFRFAATEGDIFRITSESNGDEPLDMVLRFYDETGAELGWVNDFERVGGADVRFFAAAPSTGTFYFSLEDVSRFLNDPISHPLVGGREYTYTVSFSRLSGSDREQEPNDSPVTANGFAIPQNSVNYDLSGVIGAVGDEDWYLLDVPRGVDLRLYLYPHTGSLLDHRVSVYAPWNTDEPIQVFEGLSWENRGWMPIIDPDAHLMKVESASGEGGGRHWYTLHLAHDEPFDTFNQIIEEPSDAADEAASLEFRAGDGRDEVFIVGAIEEPGDEDWLEVPCEAGTELTVSLGSSEYGSTLVALVAVVDEAGTVLLEETDTAAEGTAVIDDFAVPTAGTYYIRIRALDETPDDGLEPGAPSAYYRAGVFRSPSQ